MRCPLVASLFPCPEEENELADTLAGSRMSIVNITTASFLVAGIMVYASAGTVLIGSPVGWFGKKHANGSAIWLTFIQFMEAPSLFSLLPLPLLTEWQW